MSFEKDDSSWSSATAALEVIADCWRIPAAQNLFWGVLLCTAFGIWLIQFHFLLLALAIACIGIVY